MKRIADRTDIIVGIPTYNEADSIRSVTHKIDIGLRRDFAGYRCMLANLDSDSEDATSAEFLSTPTANSKMSINTGGDPRGKGKNLLYLFNLCRLLHARCIATIDGDVETVTPDWPKLLLRPILEENFDYTVPIYTRNRLEGNTTNHLVFPLLYGVLGADIRQPIGGEFGVSGRLCSYFLEQEIIEVVYGYGIDIFMTTHAVGGGFAIAEVFLGRKFHKPSFPKIVPMFKQVAHSAFSSLTNYIERRPEIFIRKEGTDKRGGIDDAVRKIQEDKRVLLLGQMKEEFFTNYSITEESFGSLAKEVFRELKKPTPEISADIWTDILAATVKSYLQRNGLARQLVDCLTPIFIWRGIGTFTREVINLKSKEVESLIQKQAELFKKKWREGYEPHSV